MLSKGEQLLREITSYYFFDEKPHYNKRPVWLMGLELDVFYPQFSIAFEFQGEQHFGLNVFNDYSFEKLKRQIYYDGLKKKLCSKNGILLFQIGTFELTSKHFFKMIDKNGVPDNIKIFHNTFFDRITPDIDMQIMKMRNFIKNEYRSFNNGRKIISMKNPGARQGYLEGLLKMNPRTNRYSKST